MSDRRSARERLASIPSLTGTPPAVDAAALPSDPVTLFLDWLQEAVDAAVPEPRAVTLSTVDAHGLPDSRVLILKDVSSEGWAVAPGVFTPPGWSTGNAHRTAVTCGSSISGLAEG